jgi:hypothetical protein
MDSGQSQRAEMLPRASSCSEFSHIHTYVQEGLDYFTEPLMKISKHSHLMPPALCRPTQQAVAPSRNSVFQSSMIRMTSSWALMSSTTSSAGAAWQQAPCPPWAVRWAAAPVAQIPIPHWEIYQPGRGAGNGGRRSSTAVRLLRNLQHVESTLQDIPEPIWLLMQWWCLAFSCRKMSSVGWLILSKVCYLCARSILLGAGVVRPTMAGSEAGISLFQTSLKCLPSLCKVFQGVVACAKLPRVLEFSGETRL